MNVQQLVVSKEEAREGISECEEALDTAYNPEYEQLLQVYQEVTLGKRVLFLDDIFTNVPLDEEKRPKIAISRADRNQVEVRRWSDHFTFDARKNRNSGYTGTLRIEVAAPMNREWHFIKRGYSLVPMVPAKVFNSLYPKYALRNYFILWEVEEWFSRPLAAVADRDPYLLRHLGSNIFVVEAEWDLTDLERAIMVNRRES